MLLRGESASRFVRARRENAGVSCTAVCVVVWGFTASLSHLHLVRHRTDTLIAREEKILMFVGRFHQKTKRPILLCERSTLAVRVERGTLLHIHACDSHPRSPALPPFDWRNETTNTPPLPSTSNLSKIVFPCVSGEREGERERRGPIQCLLWECSPLPRDA